MADCGGNPTLEAGLDPTGRLPRGLPGMTEPSARRFWNRTSKKGVSRPGVPGMDVGAVEYPPLDD